MPGNESASMIGRTISHYRVQSELGGGGMGVVYAAVDERLGRKVALKFLPEELSKRQESIDRFRREARAASALNHPGICTIFDIGAFEGREFIVMELLEGQTLASLITGRPMPVERVIDIGLQIADALEAAHHEGILHRDIKPANLFVTTKGRSKILDFGLAKHLNDTAGGPESETLASPLPGAAVTSPGTALGTVAYMSPEQAMGEELDVRTDLYSFGVVLYEMVTGRHAFSGKTLAVVFNAILHETPPPPSRLNEDLPAELDRIIRKLMEKDPALRYQGAAEVRSDLQRVKRDYESLRGAIHQSSDLHGGDSAAAARPHATSSYPAPSSVTSASVALPPAASGSGTAAPAYGAGRTTSRITTALKRPRNMVALVALVAALVVGGLLVTSNKGPAALTERDTILLADIENTTGEAVFDGALKQALAVQLEQSPYLNIFPQARVRQTLKFMNRSPEDKVTGTLAREICEREGLKALLTGSIASLGTHYVISLEALNAKTGETLAREQVQAEGKEKVLESLGKAASSLRGKLGESLASIEKFDAPVENATTGSLEALKAYSQGDAIFARGDQTQAIPFFQRAVELDPEFAMAHARLATIHSNEGDSDKSRAYTMKAWELRDRVSERERLYIEQRYHSSESGDLDRLIETLELYKTTYPRDFVPRNNLASLYVDVGEHEKAVAEARMAIELDPHRAFSYTNLADALISLDRFDEALDVLKQAEEKTGGYFYVSLARFNIASVRGDSTAMSEALAELRKADPNVADLAEAGMAEREGRLGFVRELSRRHVAQLPAGGDTSNAHDFLDRIAWAEATYGLDREARAHVRQGLSFSRTDRQKLELLMALAWTGDPDALKQISGSIEAKNQTNTTWENIQLTFTRAIIARVEGRHVEALDLFRSLEAFKHGRGVGHWIMYNTALTQLEAKDYANAVKSFEEVIAHRSLEPWTWQDPMAYLGLARAARAAGDEAKSRKAYEDLFEIWQHADPGLPVVETARAEYAALAP